MSGSLKVSISSSKFSPEKAHDDDAGYDIRSLDSKYLYPGQEFNPVLFRTGFKISVPVGYAALILPRSGLACKHGVTVANSPGLIDPGYTGEVLVGLINHGSKVHVVNEGDKIAQMIFVKTENVTFDHISDDELEITARSEGGFGSSGK